MFFLIDDGVVRVKTPVAGNLAMFLIPNHRNRMKMFLIKIVKKITSGKHFNFWVDFIIVSSVLALMVIACLALICCFISIFT